MLGIAFNDVAFSLMFSMLNKRVSITVRTVAVSKNLFKTLSKSGINLIQILSFT
jgi:hypothetical protein